MSWSKRYHPSKMKLMYPYICQAYKLENLFLQFLKFFFVKTASKVFSIFIGQNVEFLENISIKFSSQKAAVTYRVQVDFSNVRSTCFHEKNPHIIPLDISSFTFSFPWLSAPEACCYPTLQQIQFWFEVLLHKK